MTEKMRGLAMISVGVMVMVVVALMPHEECCFCAAQWCIPHDLFPLWQGVTWFLYGAGALLAVTGLIVIRLWQRRDRWGGFVVESREV